MNAIPAQEVAGHCLQAFTQIVPASQAAFYCVDRQLQARDFRLHQMSGEMHRDYLDNYSSIRSAATAQLSIKRSGGGTSWFRHGPTAQP